MQTCFAVNSNYYDFSCINNYYYFERQSRAPITVAASMYTKLDDDVAAFIRYGK